MKTLVLAAAAAGALSALAVPPIGSARRAAAATVAQEGAPSGALVLGSARVARRVLADGRPLAPGTYDVRLTAQEARPAAPGADAALERWAEFLQDGQVKGREVVSIVPKDEVKAVIREPAPRSGAVRVQLLKGREYLRIWFNRAGTQYLIYLPLAE